DRARAAADRHVPEPPRRALRGQLELGAGDLRAPPRLPAGGGPGDAGGGSPHARLPHGRLRRELRQPLPRLRHGAGLRPLRRRAGGHAEARPARRALPAAFRPDALQAALPERARDLRDGARMMYEGLLHIPLVVKLPGADRPRGEIGDPVQLVDVMPTVLEAIGAPVPPDVQGQALVRVTHEIVAEEHINPEFVNHYGDVYDRAIRVIYDGSYKLIATSKGERMLFDLEHDPGEARNLSADE